MFGKSLQGSVASKFGKHERQFDVFVDDVQESGESEEYAV